MYTILLVIALFTLNGGNKTEAAVTTDHIGHYQTLTACNTIANQLRSPVTEYGIDGMTSYYQSTSARCVQEQ